MMGLGSFTSSSSSITSFANRATNSVFSSLGCPTLTSLGLSIGSIVRLLKNDEENITNELKDVTLQTSTYNKIIPEVFGKVRISGNIFWSSEIKKTSIYHSQKTTKYGAQSAYTEYIVRSSFAVAVCKGVVDEITNIYADNEPLNLAVYNIKVYYGDEQQIADPTMQSFLGQDIPAFRGMCYVVFTEFPMEEFGGRIPNLTFDVARKKEIQEENDMEKLVSAVTIIPGSGEFVYDTETQKKYNGGYIFGTFYETSKATILNNHTATPNTDAVDSLNDLQNAFPNLKWISLVVCWFCDSLNCDDASVYPACENNSSITTPDEWEVAGQTRLTAHVVGCDEKGNIRFGGTPTDDCVARFAKEIKKRGLKLCLYPMLMVDTDKKPWRGHITGTANKISNFFTKSDGYNNFIKHYVSLLKDDIDAVIIGSEMKGLTSIYDEINKTYPAVNEFCNLAGEIKQLVNDGTKITYAADWSEYHHNDRSEYNLDKLWANDNIDYIGIDAYFPLTESLATTYDIDTIKNGWRSGEGWDFYYTNDERTEKGDLSPAWAWKNVEYFWSNYHYNLDGTRTAWMPKSKKIWFTEYGFPSVDCCTNQPNVFYSVGSFDSGFPRYSSGNVDFKAQRVAIMASELAWQNSECVEEMFLYTWDARPYPYFPNLSDVWGDAGCWKYGHFLNGKTGIATLANIIKYLCKQVGLQDNEFDVSLLQNDLLEGYVINDNKSILSHLKVLATAYNFDAYMDNGKIYFKSLKNTKNHIIDAENLLVDTANNKVCFNVEQASNNHLPSTIELLYFDISKDYEVSTAIAKNNSKKTISYGLSANIPMNLSQAQEIAWRILSNLSNQTKGYKLRLPITFLSIAPLDTIAITYNNEQHLMRVKSLEIIDTTTIEIIATSVIANDNILANIEYAKDNQITNSSTNATSLIPETNIDIFELYDIKNDLSTNAFKIYCAIWSDDETWNGATIYYSTDNEQNYQVLKYVNIETSVGKVISTTQTNDISSNLVDTQTKITFSLFNEDEKLQSITDEEFLQLKNKILIGNEVVVFRDVEQIDENVFQISHLLRGKFNTENNVAIHQTGERVILIDNDLVSVDIPATQRGKTIYVKAISNGGSLMDTDAISIKTKALSLIDFDAKNLSKKLLQNGNILLSFSARKKSKLDDVNNVIITNNLSLTIYNLSGLIVRKLKLQNTSCFTYTTEMQMADFGTAILPDKITYKVENLIVI